MTMPPKTPQIIMNAPPLAAPESVLRTGRALLMVDVFEYVRLMEQDEAGTVRCWQALDQAFRSRLLPRHGGRLIRSTGDGMIVEFESVPPAIECAFDMQSIAAQHNLGQPAESAMWLRVASGYGDVYAHEQDIQGKAINLVARLGTLAAPGEIVVSAAVRDRLVAGLDAEADDLGDVYLKNLPEPVRAYRLRPVSNPAEPLQIAKLPMLPAQDAARLHTGVAVLPLQPRQLDAEHAALGDLLADEIIGGLSRTGQLHVISRLSTVALAGRGLSLAQIGSTLKVAYVVSGSYVVVAGRVRVHLELARAQDQSVVWSEGLDATVAEVLMGSDAIVPRAVTEIGSTMIRQELERSITLPLPNLQSHSLLMAGISLIHRSTLRDFERAHEMLEHLAHRHARLPQPHAWLGKWHAMKLVQGLSADPAQEAGRALDQAHRALDVDPQSSLALTMKGLVQGFMLKDLSGAQQCYEAALAANPNEALAWLYTGTLRAWRGEGAAAWEAASKALALSPLDPIRYYFDSLAAFAALGAGQLETADMLATRSLSANRMHTATHRTLVIARWLRGDEPAARAVMAQMLQVEPQFSVARYLGRFPGGDTALSREYARILRAAGAPA